MTRGGKVMFDRLRASLAGHEPRRDGRDVGRAAVAAVLCAQMEPRVLFIHRTTVEGDPWSGHIAFPGGRIEPADPGAREAAEREAAEELGLNLTTARYLGQLDDQTGVTIPVCVSAFAYEVEGTPTLTPNDEVADTFWYPLVDLANPGRRVTRRFRVGDTERDHPGIELEIERKPILWGLTYRFCLQILTLAGLEGG